MDFTFYLALGTAVVVALDKILTVVAPKTKTTADDTILEKLKSLEALLEKTVSDKRAA